MRARARRVGAGALTGGKEHLREPVEMAGPLCADAPPTKPGQLCLFYRIENESWGGQSRTLGPDNDWEQHKGLGFLSRDNIY